ncbi:THAP domain-containing protein 7 [Epinephelus fuscoguttatus]|uniref:THAP domain-containing protein 7 n=1 Tax=Epinephelus fuscoguttatus TaxID=293821 RepID=UPI0020D118F5|nr:THAP domain-containing protein 7 [Epinephelus fuscoguttatus]XP_049457814.1 THAP domain-containing protein 7 [Epinephelus fuscoguttatus]
MPRHCSAGGCKSRDNRETRNAGITFHKLPKGATRRNLWITNSHRADSWDPQTDFVYFCSKHFTPESFELTGCSGIRRLKEDAFPTVFDSSSSAKCKRQGALQTQEDIPVRKKPCSADEENAQQDTDKGQTLEEPTVQRSVGTADETNENIPASSQEPSGAEQLLQQECPSPAPRPLSPSRYMRRLPPPPGFYLSKEHSYAQLCPLQWRRRYDQAIDCLEKALRQLHAARRRENRLRSTVLRLRDKRLKHTLLLSQDGCKNRGSWTPGGEKRRGKGGSNQEESETDAKSEDTGMFEDRCVDQMELGDRFLADTNSWSEEEKGYCIYCGRGQVGGQVACRVTKTGKDVQPTLHEDSLKSQRSVETSNCDTSENAKDIQIVRLKRPPGKRVETSDSNVTNSQFLLQTQGFQHAAGVSLSDTHEQSLHFLSSQQKLLLSDMCEGETESMGQEHHLDLQQQQLFWIQDSAEGQVILVPVPAEDGLQSLLKTDGVADEAQTILVSELDLKADLGHMTENSECLSRVETTCDDDHSDQHSVINTTPVAMGEDVREKLKEHLEGFHLQLSTEFIN